MQISGFEKMTLTDFPGKVACVIFTQGCNLRCPFCQNSSLLSKKENSNFQENEILKYLQKRKNLLDGIVISGGEPSLQRDLKNFIQKVKRIGLQVKLDTNGTNPTLLHELIQEELVDYVAMDIKNIFEEYASISGISNLKLENIQRSIDILKHSNCDYEFRTTIVKEFHDSDRIRQICELIGRDSKYYLQNYRDSAGVLKKGLHGFTTEELEKIRKNLKEYPLLRIRG